MHILTLCQFLAEVVYTTHVFCELLCPMCEQTSLVFGEKHEKKQGLASLYIKCSTRSCKYIHEFL